MKAVRLVDLDSRFPTTPRLRIEVVRSESAYANLADDVRAGLTAVPKSLPCKYLYDDRGSRLFDAICDLPEYYLTRTEQSLLETVADEIVGLTQPADVIELGSGTSRKTRVLLNALRRGRFSARYIPLDVNEWMLRRTAASLLRDYPELRVRGIVGDYHRDLGRIPAGANRLVLFLGSTIGNLTPQATAAFLGDLRAQLDTGDHVLLGVDLVKPTATLEAAYNDSAGVTARFSRNILQVLNRELGADFDLQRFRHIAYFSPPRSQIEIYLEAQEAHFVSIPRLGMTVPFAAGERVHTEISRKFTRATASDALEAAAFRLERWYTPANGYFGLALGRAV
jgi:L-histidine N-alpha-methyltransferase